MPLTKSLVCIAAIGAPTAFALAQADVGLCVIHQVIRWGGVPGGTITAYSIGTTSVNVGNTNLNWVQNGLNHPVIGQTMYRVNVPDGRIEQIGQSWLKHSFCALQIGSGCSSGCPGQAGCLTFLAPGCQDPYSASRNGGQTLLGPKWQVNPFTGVYSWPYDQQGMSGNNIFKRLQVQNADLDSVQNPGAIYLVEGQYVARDDALAGNHDNNASHRLVSIGASPTFQISFVASHPTVFARPAIFAWRAHGLGLDQFDPDVTILSVQVPDEGTFYVGYKVSDNGDGTWHYEYAIQNLSSHRSGRGWTVPAGTGVTATNIGFHDVDYHSGDGGPGSTNNFDGTDWPVTVGAGSVSWSTDDEATNTMANALRWGTMYNYRFDADAAPVTGTATLDLYRAGNPANVTVSVLVPGDAVVDPCPWDCATAKGQPDGSINIVDLLALLADWGNASNCDFDASGSVDIVDLLALLANWGPCP